MGKRKLYAAFLLLCLLLFGWQTSAAALAFYNPFAFFNARRVKLQANNRLDARASANLALPSAYPLLPGFPVSSVTWNIRSSPTIVDLDNDGKNELLVTDYGSSQYTSRVYAWDANANPLPGFPFSTGMNNNSHLAFGDVDGDEDGSLEIVFGGNSRTNGANGKVFIWKYNGAQLSPLNGWPQEVARYGSLILNVSSVVLADVDNNAQLDVIAGTDNNYLDSADPSYYTPNLYVWRRNGQPMSGWPVDDDHNVAIQGTVAVGKFDADDSPDIVTGRDYHRLFAYNKAGQFLSGWPKYIALNNDHYRIEFSRSAVTLADLDKDGSVEFMAAGLRRQTANANFFGTNMLVLQSNAQPHSGWEDPAAGNEALSYQFGYPLKMMQQAVSVADLNGDGKLDMVVPTQDGYIRAWQEDKTLLWEVNYAQGHFIYASEAVIGDVDGDGLSEIIFGTYDPLYGNAGPVGLWILEHDGSPKAGLPWSSGTSGIISAPSLGDLDKDGDVDIAATTLFGKTYVWDAPAPYNPATLAWPVARFNIQRTAYANTQAAGLNLSSKTVSPPYADVGAELTYTIDLQRSGPALTNTVYLSDTLPGGLSYIPNSLTATQGVVDDSRLPELYWSGLLSDTNHIVITYAARVTETEARYIKNSATISVKNLLPLERSAGIVVNGEVTYLPLVFK